MAAAALDEWWTDMVHARIPAAFQKGTGDRK
jgi:hypothetical protein